MDRVFTSHSWLWLAPTPAITIPDAQRIRYSGAWLLRADLLTAGRHASGLLECPGGRTDSAGTGRQKVFGRAD